MSKICGVYWIRNLINGKVYVGSSTDSLRRFSDHRNRLKKGTHANRHLQGAWLKYGEANFVFEMLTLCQVEGLSGKEQIYIDCTDCILTGYNMSPLANLPPMTEETKKKIGQANKGRKPWITGKTHSPETKQKLRATSLANNCMKGKNGPKHQFFGKKHSDDTKTKMKLAKIGCFNNASSKSVDQLDGGVIIASYPSAREAQRQTGIEAKNIAAVLKNKRTKAGGFVWEYHERIQ